MFCGECGTKNEAGSAFCQNCGKPLSTEPVVTEKSVENAPVQPTTVVPKQPMSKKKKTIIIAVVAVVAILGVSYKVLSDKFSPKNVAKDYINAIVKCDGKKMYSYLDTSGNNEFLDKSAFLDYVKEECENDVTNFKITKVEYSDSKLSATVTFSYTSKSDGEDTSKIVLTKSDKKKLLIFDKWIVGDEFASSIKENYAIKVNKGSKITFGDKAVGEKYLDSKKSNENIDCYVLPKVLAIKTNVKVTLANGFTYESKVVPSSYDKDLTLDEDVIDTDTKTKVYDASKDIITKLYTAIIEGKSGEDVKTMFNHKADLTNLVNNYNKTVEAIPRSYSIKLTKFEVTSGSLYDLGVTKDGNFEVEVKLYYNYDLNYTDYSGSPKTNSDSDYSYITITLDYDNGEFYLVDATDLEDYFSIY